LKKLRAVATEVKICGTREIDFPRALRWLRKQWGIKRLLCEGGGELNDALFRADLVNQLHLTVCPRVFGGRTAPTIADGLGASSLARATQLELESARRQGNEMFLVYRVLRK
jgi:riboflavin biosynthesis pyrimidine reductase